ncbi:hypothetical protein KV557_06810 [Kitasatospora aureofaciens]|uniref:nitrilase-related carbon-nitrogen hydrolase n=1 Tax=Kitasatospora aureofaciens TaxID=1894 RepID=UPI001C489586|nr:nitrilase-related carbon-nitrogen hydrolase [Kitasatospora aureofaciens]MBV6696836.1 hypothetical protein [Kitasatospora aureofaciens]
MTDVNGSERELVVAVAQPRCVAYDVAENAVAHAEVVRAARAPVVVFPELSLTGYELDAALVRPEDERLAPIVAACAETGAVALVGAAAGLLTSRPKVSNMCCVTSNTC